MRLSDVFCPREPEPREAEVRWANRDGKNMGERVQRSEPLNRCYTMRGRSPRVQRHKGFHRKSEAFGFRRVCLF